MPSFLSSSDSKPEPREDGIEPNPLATDGPSDLHIAQTLKSYVKGHKVVDALSGASSRRETKQGADAADAALPKVSEKDAHGPEVVYANGVPLDIAGYHQRVDSPMPMPDPASEGLDAFGDRRRSEGLEGEVTIGGGCELA